jgi:zinc/manganese transport system substrate-binding protein
MKKIALLVAVPAVLVLAACGAQEPAAGGSDGVSIVASTDVWGDIASVVGGDRVNVTSIIDSPDKDPHEYEATARDQLALSRAAIVIENGGGYDPFIDTMLEAGDADPEIINAVDLSGLAPAEDDHAAEEDHADEHEASEHGHEHIEGFNEHVWYDLGTADAVAAEIAEKLTDLDPEGAETYTAGLADFRAQLAPVQAEVDRLHGVLEGQGVAVTEPVPVWLLSAMGLENRTPEAFSEAVEEDSDVPAATLNSVLELISDGSVSLLAYNDQTETGQTQLVRDAAASAGVPVVNFTETVPEGDGYADWMKGNVEAVADALGV